MQGERGMWFKETFHEHATRIPFFIYSTNNCSKKYNLNIKPVVIDKNVSLIDLFPTLAHISNC